MEIEIHILLLLISLILGYILGRWRDSNKTLFEQKLKIYSKAVYELNADIFIFNNLKSELDWFEGLTKKEREDIFSNNSRETPEEVDIDLKVKTLRTSLEKHDHKKALIRTLSPVRLIGSKKVVKAVREHYTLVEKFIDISKASLSGEDKKKHEQEISDKIIENVMEVEQLMREDLLGFWERDISRKKIREYVLRKNTSSDN